MTTTETADISDIADEAYHQHPALSYSNGRQYLRSPAHYLHAKANRRETPEFDLGQAVHSKVLGIGMQIVEIPVDILSADGGIRSKAAKEFVISARRDGLVPLKADVVTTVDTMAERLLTHPEARKYLELPGQPEVALMAADPETGVTFRGKLDYLPDRVEGRRTFPIDLKTTTDASDREAARSVIKWDYDLQAALYRRLITLVRGDDTGPFIQIYIEVDPPHGVNVFQLAHEDWIAGGAAKLDYILRLHAKCIAEDRWPDYPVGTHVLMPPAYYLSSLDRLADAS